MNLLSGNGIRSIVFVWSDMMATGAVESHTTTPGKLPRRIGTRLQILMIPLCSGRPHGVQEVMIR